MRIVETPVAGRAAMISTVVHTALLGVVVIWALHPARDRVVGIGGEKLCGTMDIVAVQLAAPAVTPPAAARAKQEPAPIVAVHHEAPVAAVPVVQQSVVAALTTGPAIETQPSGIATQFYGVPAIGKSVVFVIDRSASMGLDGRLDRARHELAQSLHRLPATARFQVIAYHRIAETLVLDGHRHLVAATPTAFDAAIAFIERLAPEGATDHAAALRNALALEPEVIYFLTDDDDLTATQVQDITRRNRRRACIHALCFVRPYDSAALADLARQNGGTFAVIGR